MTKNKWNQIHSCLDKMPNQMTTSYNEKLNVIKKKIQSLEKSWNMINEEIGKNNPNKQISFQTKKLFKKKKLLQLEYLTHLKSLSLILMTLQNIQY